MALESSAGGFYSASNSRDYESKSTIFSWPIQKIQNSCHKILQSMQVSEWYFIVQKQSYAVFTFQENKTNFTINLKWV